MSNILHSQERADVLAHVAGNLRFHRQAAGMTQTRLAAAAGISRRMITAVESGDANISLSSLDRLAAALGIGFVDLVRDRTQPSTTDINAVTWRGRERASAATLLCSAPAMHETQMWIWTLAPGERYQAEPDPQGWHEMIYVTEGTLRLELSGTVQDYETGAFAVYGTAQIYAYANPGSTLVRFVRNVVC